MDTKGTHIIQKSHLKITVRDEKAAFGIQSRMAAAFAAQGLAALERELDHMVPSDRVITLDRLTLDLGSIDLDDLENELPRLITAKVRAALDQTLSADQRDKQGGFVQMDVQMADLQVLLRFLEQGTTSWQVSSGDLQAPELLARLLTEQPSALAAALKPMLVHRHVRERLSLQFPASLLRRLISLIAPDRAVLVEPLQAKLDALAPFIRSIPQSQVKRNAWVVHFVLAPSVETGGHPAIATTVAWSRLLSYLLAEHWLDQHTLAHDVAGLTCVEAATVLMLLDETAAPLLARVQMLQSLDVPASRTVLQAASALFRAAAMDRFGEASMTPILAMLSRLLAAQAPQIGPRLVVAIAIALGLKLPTVMQVPQTGAARKMVRTWGKRGDVRSAADLADLLQDGDATAQIDGLQDAKSVNEADASQDAKSVKEADASQDEDPQSRITKKENFAADDHARSKTKTWGKEDLARGEKGNAFTLKRLPLTARKPAASPDFEGLRRYKGPFRSLADEYLATEATATSKSGPSKSGRKRRNVLPSSSVQQVSAAEELTAERKRSRARKATPTAMPSAEVADANDEQQVDEIADANAQKALSEINTRSKTRPKPQPVYGTQLSWDNDAQYYVENSGLVLLNPFFQPCFAEFGWLEKGEFVDEEAQENAVLLLAYMSSGELEISESYLPLAKVLCGMEIGRPVRMQVDLPQAALDESDNLLLTASGYWEKAGKLTPDQFRATFLRREGRLENIHSGWNLKVDRQTIDILLEFLPWGFGTIKLPWMRQLFTVDW